MKYHCPSCTFGNLLPAKITYVRLWGQHLITIPNFAAWHCDSCGYTRYDSAALARVELLFGLDSDTMTDTPQWHSRQTEGPGERGPRRWSF
jgi:YgiT-type zinc finger domain-containing protein